MYPLVNKHNYGKSRFMGDLPIKMVIFHSKMSNYQRDSSDKVPWNHFKPQFSDGFPMVWWSTQRVNSDSLTARQLLHPKEPLPAPRRSDLQLRSDAGCIAGGIPGTPSGTPGKAHENGDIVWISRGYMCVYIYIYIHTHTYVCVYTYKYHEDVFFVEMNHLVIGYGSFSKTTIFDRSINCEGAIFNSKLLPDNFLGKV